MSQMRNQRRSGGTYAQGASRASVYGTSALKNAVHTSSNETAAPRQRVQENARTYTAPHRDYFESVQPRRAAAPQSKVLSKGRILIIALTAIAVVTGFLWIGQLVSYLGISNTLKTERDRLDALKADNAHMTQQLQLLKDGERIRTYAVNKLGMVAPGKGEERTISIILPRTQDVIASAQDEMHYTLLDVLVDMLWF